MSIPFGRGAITPSRRGQSTVLGIVLLIGMVAAGSIGILLVAGDSISDIEHESEQDRIEQSFVQLSQSLDSSTTGDTSNNINLQAGEDGAIAKAETGEIVVESDGLEEDIELTFGTIEYEGEDDTKIAYEAGGVFRETGQQTRVVSSPKINYDHETETLSLPVVTVVGDEQLGTGDISMTQSNTTTFADSNVVEDESVDITIRSEYWRGWISFFQQQAGHTSIRNVEHLDGDAAKVTIRVGYLEFDEAFDRGLSVSDSWDTQGSDGNKEDIAEALDPQHGSYNEMDPIINEIVDDVKNDSYEEDVEEEYGTITGDEDITNGTYFAEEVDLTEDLEVDLSDGNATLVVDGNVSTNNENLTVTNWENPDGKNHTLKVYSTGNLHVSGGDVGPKPIDGDSSAEQLQVYGTSTMSSGIDGGSYTGVIFSPSDDFEGPNEVIKEGQCDDHQVCVHSNPEFTGSIVADSVHFQSDAMNVSYDESLEDADINVHPESYSLPPQLTYLNVAHHEIEVRNR